MFDYVDDTTTYDEAMVPERSGRQHRAAATQPTRSIETYCATLAERKAVQEAVAQEVASASTFQQFASFWQSFVGAFVESFANAGRSSAGPVGDICRFRRSVEVRAASIGWMSDSDARRSGDGAETR